MWSLVRPPCRVEVRVGVCARYNGGRAGFTIAHIWMSVSQPTVWLVHSLHFHHICLWEREKRGRAITEPSSLFPCMASAGGNCPSLSSYLAEVFFTPPHVKFINISPSFFFSFFLLPLRMSSDQVFLPSWFLLSPKWPRQMYGVPKSSIHENEAKTDIISWMISWNRVGVTVFWRAWLAL